MVKVISEEIKYDSKNDQYIKTTETIEPHNIRNIRKMYFKNELDHLNTKMVLNKKRTDYGPSFISNYYKDDKLIATREIWYDGPILSRKDGPAITGFTFTSDLPEVSKRPLIEFEWFTDNLRNNFLGPSLLRLNFTDDFQFERLIKQHCINGKLLPPWVPRIDIDGKIIDQSNQIELTKDLLLKTILEFDREYGSFLAKNYYNNNIDL